MKPLLTVVCFLWGDWPAKGWGEEYVKRLYNGVKRFCPVDFSFVCYADQCSRLDGVEFSVRPLLAPIWSGCLPKLFVHSPLANLSGRVLVFDLDNVIVGDLSPLIDQFDNIGANDLIVRGKFVPPMVPDGDMMAFYAGNEISRKLWSTIYTKPMQAFRDTGGRERFFIRQNCEPLMWQDLIGDKPILSYKRHLKSADTLPEGAAVVSFHDGGGVGGTMRPHQVDKPWVKEFWA